MIPGMYALTARLAGARGAAPRWLPAVLAGVAGCLFLAVAASPRQGPQTMPLLDSPFDIGGGAASNIQDGIGALLDWAFVVAPTVAAVFGLCLLRWWPYLLVVAGLILVPNVIAEWNFTGSGTWSDWAPPSSLGYALAVIALLACAQGVFRTSAGWGAAVAALVLGSVVVGSAMEAGDGWETSINAPAAWHTALLAAGIAGLAPAVWTYRRGDPAATGPAGKRPWQRIYLIVAGILAAALPVLLIFLTTQRMADLLGVAWSALARHDSTQYAVIGVITLVTVTLLVAPAGRWPLAGALTAIVVQMAVTAPFILAVTALAFNDPQRWLAALAAAALGAAAAGSRWRVPLAATLAVLAAIALTIAYAATTGDPEKLADQNAVIPSVLTLVSCAAASGAVTGATVPVLAARGALPAVLGPLTGTLVVAGSSIAGKLDALPANYRSGNGLYTGAVGTITSAVLFLVAAAAVSGLGLAQLLAARSAERKHAEQIRREAATAERDRLGRSIHDGVLQVLALVQRQGSELGAQGSELAALAGEQEAALRGLLAGSASTRGGTAEDLRGPLQALATPAVEVATPAQAVELPSSITAEVVAAVRAALDNVRKHAGADARACILLEDEQDGVRVTVRDDGTGFPPERLAEAAAAGRLGIVQSMRGRIADCGGTTTIDSRPGEGTEVEFWIPSMPQARQ
jgi:signal transduction histidine kinase